VGALHDVVMWHRAKQEIAPRAAPFYGDLVARLVAASRGKSAKCLVLDLDNTLWGGVIGDDGMEGIVLGQGSAEGEAFVAVQAYAKGLAARGVALAVCSKNDDAVARAVFEQHPEMVLRMGDIACFVANWRDKASNIREIAATLRLGVDALVFVDDNPAERAQVRREVPEVRVVEVPEEPALVAGVIAASGYFESVGVTGEDLARSGQYAANLAREAMKPAGDGSDMAGYLQSLRMRLVWRRFDRVGLGRIAQLINKTNQFNLTTIRYGEDEVAGMIDAAGVCGLQFRLVDLFGDNGMIGVVILRDEGGGGWGIDSWLMSCRVLGRQVEAAMLGVVVEVARGLGARALRGRFVASGRNDMVREHYARLGFMPVGEAFELVLDGFPAADVPMMIEEG
jgi:FkbH-like protein